jgi:hypothetical protein
MSKAAQSILVFGIYVLVSGLTLLVSPGLVLGLLNFPTEDEIWVRVLGFVVAVLGYYYIQAARHEVTPFFRWTVQARPLAILFFIVLALLRLAEPILMVFGAVDLLGAVWTGLALRDMQR